MGSAHVHTLVVSHEGYRSEKNYEKNATISKYFPYLHEVGRRGEGEKSKRSWKASRISANANFVIKG